MYVLYEFKIHLPMFQTRIFLSGEIKVLPWLTEESWEEIIPLKIEEKSSNIVPYMHITDDCIRVGKILMDQTTSHYWYFSHRYAIKSHLHHWKVPNNLKFKNKLKIWFKPARESPLQNNTISTNVYIQSKHLVFWLINVPYITPYFFKYKNIFHHWPVVEWYLHLTVLKRILDLVTQCQLNRQRGPIISHLSAWKNYKWR